MDLLRNDSESKMKEIEIIKKESKQDMKIKKMSKKSKCTNPNWVLIGPLYLLQDFVSSGETECSTSVHKQLESVAKISNLQYIGSIAILW